MCLTTTCLKHVWSWKLFSWKKGNVYRILPLCSSYFLCSFHCYKGRNDLEVTSLFREKQSTSLCLEISSNQYHFNKHLKLNWFLGKDHIQPHKWKAIIKGKTQMKKTRGVWHAWLSGWIISVKQEDWGNELSVLHWGANQYRQQSYLQGYYFLHKMNGNQCLRKLLQSPAGASRIQLGLM